MQVIIITTLLIMIPVAASSQNNPQKYALVIGNGAYSGITPLNNPPNDAEDMAAVLSDLGFTVDKVINGSLEIMENAILRLRNRLSVSGDSYGFFFYAGHGVQSNGENYLIPVDASIQSEGNLRVRAVSVQAMLDDLNMAGNELNIVVLDACRDNPFRWNRSSNRGLAMITTQPAHSIIVYATSAGSTASDGTGRNGLFTEHLLNNIKNTEIDINEVFRLTMGDVAKASNNLQRPAVYSQFSEIAYLGMNRTNPVRPAQVFVTPTPDPIRPNSVPPAPVSANPNLDTYRSNPAPVVPYYEIPNYNTAPLNPIQISPSPQTHLTQPNRGQDNKSSPSLYSFTVEITYMTQGGTKRTDSIVVLASDPRTAEREAETQFARTNSRSTIISAIAK